MPSPATHLRAPLLWLLLPLMAGYTVAGLRPAPAAGLGPLVAAAGILALAAGILAARPGWMARVGWGGALLLSAGLAGFAYLHLRQPHWHEWSDRPPREITVTVEVTRAYPAAPDARSLAGLGHIVAAGSNEQELVGRRVYFSAIRRISVAPRRSGRYVMQGVLEPLPRAPADASFEDYLENLGIRHKLTRAHIQRETRPPDRFHRLCSRAQDRLESILRRGLEHHPEIATLYLAMLLGEKAALSTEQQNAFMRSGTFHVFSISGLHVGVIAGAILGLLGLLRVPRRPTAGLGLLVLWLYVQITGASAPAERAFLMILCLLVSRIFRLPGNALAALVTAALLTLLLDPLQLFSTGFQMSYSVVLALVVMGRPLGERWLAAWRPFAALPRMNWTRYHGFIEWAGRKILGGAAACWTAFLASTPAGIGYFHLFSPGSLAANLIVIPLAMLAIVAGFVSLLAGLVGLMPWSTLFNSAAAVTLIAMDWLVRQGTTWPGIYFAARFRAEWMAPAAVAGMAAVLLAGVAGRWSRRRGGFWLPAAALALILIFLVKFG